MDLEMHHLEVLVLQYRELMEFIDILDSGEAMQTTRVWTIESCEI